MLTDHNNLLLQSAEKILWVEQSYLSGAENFFESYDGQPR